MIIKTPGVYIKETNNFPPSIVEASTAVPVFIGYTERVPTESTAPFAPLNDVFISNMLDFKAAFGGAYPVSFAVDMQTPEIVQADFNFYLFDSLDLYFRNGGGPCYVISAGAFSSASLSSLESDMTTAIAKIDKVGDATIVLAPDLHLKEAGASIGPAAYGTLSSQILNVCGTEKDKFALFDYISMASNPTEMRDEISPSAGNLKYGALYYPWLKNGKSFSVAYDDLTSAPVSTIATTSAVGSKVLTESINQINDEMGYLKTELTLNEVSVNAQNQTYQGLLTAYNNAAAGSKRTALTSVFEFLHNLLDQLAKAEAEVIANDSSSPFLTNIDQLKINTGFISEVQKLIRFVELLKSNNPDGYNTSFVKSSTGNWLIPSSSEWFNPSGVSDSYSTVAGYTTELNVADLHDATAAQPNTFKSRDKILSDFNAGMYVDYQLIFASIASLADGLTQRKQQLERRLFTEDQVYVDIQKAVQQNRKQIPSQGAIAGVYCANDRNRGVWKSPANIAVQGIEKPMVEVSNREQDDLNVHAGSGKSINVIRTFTGKGPLVWGARTLAGNDNEWRYISVRRFFNYAEESIGTSLQDFVFEPNNALTWVKIKAMITSFLVNQWQSGALVGAKMDEAFFVKVGEDTTTPAEINNGIINIQIGLAVARPAEFIIIEFNHYLKS